MADHIMDEFGKSSGERPPDIFLTPASKSTRTPSRSQNILYSDDDNVDDGVVDDVIVGSLEEVPPPTKNADRDFCVFVLECCKGEGGAGRLDMIEEKILKAMELC